MFTKILIANRGAIARRVVRACTELGVASAAVYSDADAGAPHLAEATEAHRLPGERAEETYLDADALLRAVADSGADAVHPGYGFLAENPEFAERVQHAGATFIGPDPRWLRVLGDKTEARRLMAQAGFPVFPGTEPVADLAAAREAAAAIGFPLMLKPTVGGGGIGMRVVRDAAELEGAYRQSTQLAQRAFGRADVYLERWLPRPRHIEFQLLADGRGAAVHLGERECSIQRRHQKVIEEAPAPGLDRAELDTLADKAANALAQLGYDNVGTLETLRDASGAYGFLELNPRIQVEHGVTEAVTGVDLVISQIRLAAGEGLPAPAPFAGHALEARVYAEDPESGLPATGTLTRFELPRMQYVRIETGYGCGQSVTPHYDPLLAKVIAWGTTREQAIGRVLVGLRALVVRGVKTNVPLLLRVLESEPFLAGRVDTGFLYNGPRAA